MNLSPFGFGLLAVALGMTGAAPGWAQEKPAPRAILGFEANDARQSALDAPETTSTVGGFLPTIKSVAPTPLAANGPVPVDALNVSPETRPFRGRLSLRGDAGDGVGYRRGFTYLEAMLPILQDTRSLFFTDLRVVNFLDDDRWEYNAGLGYRWHSERCECIFGVNTFYDSRKTDFHSYHQLGVGIEALRPDVEFRANGYFIVGPAGRQIGDTGLVNLGAVNNNFVLQRLQTIERALTGFDMEVGAPIPGTERFLTRAYIGYYTYSAEDISALHGIRGRLESQVSERVSLHFAIQHDRLFDTTVTGGLAIHFGAPAYRSGTGRASWDDVLRQRVHRDVNIVISQTTTTTTQLQPVPPPPPPPPPPEEPKPMEGSE